jgi:hypothetical protein
MANLQEISDELDGAYAARSGRFTAASRSVQYLLLISAAVAGVAHFFAGNEIAHVVGVSASIAVLIAGVVIVITEHDASNELHIARRAIEAARPTNDTIAQAQETIDRIAALYQADAEMRGVIQEALLAPGCAYDVEGTIKTHG